MSKIAGRLGNCVASPVASARLALVCLGEHQPALAAVPALIEQALTPPTRLSRRRPTRRGRAASERARFTKGHRDISNGGECHSRFSSGLPALTEMSDIRDRAGVFGQQRGFSSQVSPSNRHEILETQGSKAHLRSRSRQSPRDRKDGRPRRSQRERRKVEMLFAHLKRIFRLDRLRLRGPNGARDEFLLAATPRT